LHQRRMFTQTYRSAELASKIIYLCVELPDEVRNHPIEKEYRALVQTLCNQTLESETGMGAFTAPSIMAG
jgi:hypothetical protein